MRFKQIKPRSWRLVRHFLSAPFIWGLLVPLVLLDVCIEVYHHICFPLYRLEKVPRGRYVKIDRHKLQYLSRSERVQCAYCGYANGLLAYAVEIVARTERYWCGIRHAPQPGFVEPAHHADFIDYGDEAAYRALGKTPPSRQADETPERSDPA